MQHGRGEKDAGGHTVQRAADGPGRLPNHQRPSPELLRVLEGETGPHQREKRYSQKPVLEALGGVHAEIGGAVPSWCGSTAPALPYLADPVSDVMQRHEADGERNDDQVESPD